MKNSGFYDENGKLIDVTKYGITIEQLCDYKLGLDSFEEDLRDKPILYLIINNFNLRKKYLVEYSNVTNSINEKMMIKDFVNNFKYLNEQRRYYNSINKNLDEFKNEVEDNKELEFKKIQELYQLMGETYENMIKKNLDPDIVNSYIDSLQDLVSFYHKMYNYNLNIDPTYKNLIEKYKNIGK